MYIYLSYKVLFCFCSLRRYLLNYISSSILTRCTTTATCATFLLKQFIHTYIHAYMYMHITLLHFHSLSFFLFCCGYKCSNTSSHRICMRVYLSFRSDYFVYWSSSTALDTARFSSPSFSLSLSLSLTDYERKQQKWSWINKMIREWCIHSLPFICTICRHDKIVPTTTTTHTTFLTLKIKETHTTTENVIKAVCYFDIAGFVSSTWQ